VRSDSTRCSWCDRQPSGDGRKWHHICHRGRSVGAWKQRFRHGHRRNHRARHGDDARDYYIEHCGKHDSDRCGTYSRHLSWDANSGHLDDYGSKRTVDDSDHWHVRDRRQCRPDGYNRISHDDESNRDYERHKSRSLHAGDEQRRGRDSSGFWRRDTETRYRSRRTQLGVWRRHAQPGLRRQRALPGTWRWHAEHR
jgi:hypothetical protein